MTDEAGLLREALPFIRHKATCLLNAVRDNPPDDESCTCGLREFWRAALADAQVPARTREEQQTGLDRALRRVVAGLPEGVHVCEMEHDGEPPGRWQARTWANGHSGNAIDTGEGATLVEALKDLDRILSEARP